MGSIHTATTFAYGTSGGVRIISEKDPRSGVFQRTRTKAVELEACRHPQIPVFFLIDVPETQDRGRDRSPRPGHSLL